MSPRLRKLIGLFGILAFLGFYVWLVVAIGERIPQEWWALLPFYGVAGILWFVPITPLIRWMETGR